MKIITIVESIQPVLQQSQHVHLGGQSIDTFVSGFDKSKCQHWLSVSPFDLQELNKENRLGFLMTLDSISFSYWGDPKWTVEYNGKKYDGTQAMIICLRRAIDENTPIYDPSCLADMTPAKLKKILRGNIEIPLLEERVRILNQVGIVTLDRFSGKYEQIIEEAEADALRLVSLLISSFPFFEDNAVYHGNRVYFNKRAQLLASDIHHVIHELGNADAITACADYKLPLVLRRHGILQYDTELHRKINAHELIPGGSDEEIEIRAHTLQAVELIKHGVSGVTATQINDYLWIEGQTRLLTDGQYHLTRTIAY
ncbi:MAG: queuosine salvage family protein [Candidatus Woesearchaeota archaeon]|jgi:hypothetical protein